jgi:hypothetical protein
VRKLTFNLACATFVNIEYYTLVLLARFYGSTHAWQGSVAGADFNMPIIVVVLGMLTSPKAF